MDDLLALAQDAPRRTLAPDESLISEGSTGNDLYVLLDGTLRVEKRGALVAVISTRGACVGELALLLDVPATADVRAATPATVAVIANARTLVHEDARITLALARVLATRLQTMTSYLADLRTQYADHEGGLGMIDVVLESLLQSPGRTTRLSSARDPDPEY